MCAQVTFGEKDANQISMLVCILFYKSTGVIRGTILTDYQLDWKISHLHQYALDGLGDIFFVVIGNHRHTHLRKVTLGLLRKCFHQSIRRKRRLSIERCADGSGILKSSPDEFTNCYHSL